MISDPAVILGMVLSFVIAVGVLPFLGAYMVIRLVRYAINVFFPSRD